MSFTVAIAVASPKVMDVRIHDQQITVNHSRKRRGCSRTLAILSILSVASLQNDIGGVNISLDGYIQHRNAPHDSFQEIVSLRFWM